MPELIVEADTPNSDPREVLTALSDFRSYPVAADDIKSISVEDQGGGVSVSEWEVAFRGGIIRWTQRDRLDTDAGVIEFEQIEGDSEVWEGKWVVEPGRVRFEVEYDMGIPALADQLNPLAARSLHDVIVAIIRGRVGADARIVSTPPA